MKKTTTQKETHRRSVVVTKGKGSGGKIKEGKVSQLYGDRKRLDFRW